MSDGTGDTEDKRTRRRPGTLRVTLDLMPDERAMLDRVRDQFGARSYVEAVSRSLRWVDGGKSAC